MRLDAPQCSSARLLPALGAECALALAVLWRLVHQLQWRSHPRRVFFHLVLLLACALRGFAWGSLCRSALLSPALAALWAANALLLLCAAAIVFTWAAAVAAGRVPTVRLVRSSRCWALHPLVLLHVVHLGFSIAAGVSLLVHKVSSSPELSSFLSPPEPLFVAFRAANAATVAVDGASAARVAIQLRSRLLSAAMTDDMKRKSVLQMTLLIAVISSALALQLAMDVVVLIEKGDLVKAFGDQVAFSTYCQLAYFAPGLLLSIAFLYIMRRVEQRDPTRLVVLPARSLVEFVECSSPNCVWCAHHRRFHNNHRNTHGRKWDLSLFAAALSLSPQTVDSSVHSAAPSSAHANPSLDSWPSSTESVGFHLHGDHHFLPVTHPSHQHQHIQDDDHYRAFQSAPPRQTPQQLPRQHGRGRDRNQDRVYPRIR